MIIGDKVEIINKHRFQGECGTIISIDSLKVGVEFDKYIGGHNCDGMGRDGYSWYVSHRDIKLIDKPEEEYIKIKWFKDGKLEKN